MARFSIAVFSTIILFLLGARIAQLQSAPEPSKPIQLKAVDTPDLSGYYTVTDKGTTYLAIIRKAQSNYRFVWLFSTGERALGVGYLESGHMHVGWSIPNKSVGVCRYRLEWHDNKPALVGDRHTTERLEFLRGLK